MAFDEGLAQRIRDVLGNERDVVEKRMFGGLCFMWRGNMCVGIVKDNLMVRVGPDNYEALLKEKHAKLMDFTGKPMKGMLYIEPKGVETEQDLTTWIDTAKEFVSTLPKK